MITTRTLTIAAFLLSATPAYASFSDVPPNHPNADAIGYVQAEGIVEGYADGTYKPNQLINRAEFMKILIGSEYKNIQVTGPDDFPDVPGNAWYAGYVSLAYNRGYISGYPDGTFRPSVNINFVEAAKIISKVFIFEEEETSIWYERYVRSLESRSAIPLSITRFDQPITRGEMAEMIYRLKLGITDLPSKTYERLSNTDARVTAEIKDVTADYPADWGPLVQNPDQNTEFPNDVLMFQKLNERNRYPQGDNEMLQIFTRFYDTGANRYEEVCVNLYELCETMERSDMLKQKSDLEAEATMEIAGNPAVFEENYNPPSGYIIRLYRFFTLTNRIEISVGYDVGDLYEEEYERRVEAGGSSSISELVREDLGEDYANPYSVLRSLYPNETVGMQRFFAEVDAMIGSMR